MREAGFDGLATRVCDDELCRAARDEGLFVIGGEDVGSSAECERKLHAARDLGMRFINVQLCDHDTPVEKALPLAVEVMRLGRELGMKPCIEVHRDTCTETPEKAFALADAYEHETGEKLVMNFDHSHPAIIKHLSPDAFWERLGVRTDLLHLSEMMHIRPFNGHHCQIPVSGPENGLSPEFAAWLPFCRSLLAEWRGGGEPTREFLVVPELGPQASGYGLSCFPDVWSDVCLLANEIRRCVLGTRNMSVATRIGTIFITHAIFRADLRNSPGV